MDLFSSLLDRALPDLKLILILAPLALIYTMAGGIFSGWLRTKKQIKTAYTRKIFHFYVFTMAGILHLTLGLPAVVVFGSCVCLCVLYAVYRGDGYPFYEAMARPSDEPHRSFFILIPMVTTLLGGGLANLFFPAFAYVGYFVGGWGDAIAEPVGTRWGKHRYKVPSLMGVPATRSLEGSFSVFLAGSVVGILALAAGGVPLSQALFVGVACGLAGTLAEAVSSHGLDNLTIQVAAAATAALLLM
jgi:phytol kinase